MIKAFWIFIIGLICQGLSQGFDIDLKTSSVIFKDDVFRLYVNTTGGVEPIRFQFGELPQTWVAIGPYVFIPKAEVSAKRKHIVRVEATDGIDAITKGTIVLISNGLVLSIQQNLYPFDQTFPDDFVMVEEEQVETPLPEARTPYTDPEQFINNARVGQVRTQLTIDPTYSILPEMTRIDQFIKTRNVNFLIQTIEQVRKLNLQCVEKVSYLEEIAARIGSAVEFQKMEISKLKIFDLAAKEEFRRLQEELDRLQKQQESMRLSLLLPKHTDMKNELENIQNLLPSILAEIQTLQFEVAELKLKIVQLIQEASRIKGDLSQISLILPGLPSNQITSTSIQLQALETRSKEIQFEASRLNITLTTKEDDLQNLVKLQIRFKSKRSTMIQEVAVLEENIQNNDEKILHITQEINSIRIQMISAEQNNKSSQIFIAEGEVASLKSLWESIQLQIDVTAFSCYGITNVLIGESNYTLSSGDFLNYIKSMYGIDSLSVAQSEVQIQDVDIFSSYWQKLYGSAFDQAAIALSTAGTSANQLRFQNDFTCLEPSQLQNEEGIVLSIANNLINVRVQSTQQEAFLIMGACTKFQSAFDLPRQGSYIKWWGIPSIEGVYDAYLIMTIPSPYYT